MKVTRESQRVGIIYVTPRAEDGEPNSVFFTPDGTGRVWFDTVVQARSETGLSKVVYLGDEPDEI